MYIKYKFFPFLRQTIWDIRISSLYEKSHKIACYLLNLSWTFYVHGCFDNILCLMFAYFV